MLVRVQRAVRKNCFQLLPWVSKPDRIDLRIGWGVSAKKGIPMSFDASDPMCRWSIFADDRIYGMFGCTPNGETWLFRSFDFDQLAIRFIRHAKPFVGYMLTRHPHLAGWANASNTKLLRWLQWAGFSVTVSKSGYAKYEIDVMSGGIK